MADTNGTTEAGSGRVGGAHAGLVSSAVALIGIAFAILLVWLSFRKSDLPSVLTALRAVRIELLMLGALLYFVSVLIRGLRWRVLLSRAGAVTRRASIVAMLVGFATNFALPGRLGEVYRADYLNGLTQISRITALGSIVVERVMDGLILAAMLCLTTVEIGLARHSDAGIPVNFLVTAVVLFVAIASGALIVRRIERLPLPVIGPLFDRFKIGLNTIDATNLLPFLGFTVAVWALEALALTLLLSSFGIAPTLVGVMLVLSASSLSTILPTAPAFIGSYQFAYVLTFGALGWAQPLALAASITVQLAFFAPVMIIGFALALRTYGRIFLRGGAGRDVKAEDKAPANG